MHLTVSRSKQWSQMVDANVLNMLKVYYAMHMPAKHAQCRDGSAMRLIGERLMAADGERAKGLLIVPDAENARSIRRS